MKLLNKVWSRLRREKVEDAEELLGSFGHTLQESYQLIFNTRDGKRILRHLMKVGFISETTYVIGDRDQTLLNEGTRRLVLSMHEMVHGKKKKPNLRSTYEDD